MAADLAGVVLTKPEIEVASKVVRAEIVNHPQDSVGGGDDGTSATSGKKNSGACVVQ